MQNRLGVVAMIVGGIMVLASLVFVFNNLNRENNANYAQKYVEPQVEALINRNVAMSEGMNRDLVLDVDGYGYIGYLKISDIDLKLPVMDHWDYERLNISPCRYSGSLDERNLVIAAHNFQRHFGLLTTLKKGSLVQFIDAYGAVHLFVVNEIEELQRTDVEKMKNSDADLTLFTCTYGGFARVTVRCDRVY